MISSESTFHLYKVRSEIESRLCWLVIAYILGSDTDSVYRFFKEGVESVFGRDSRYVEPERSVVLGAYEYFFPPVAYNVTLETRIRFRSIVEKSSCEFDKRNKLFVFPVVFNSVGFTVDAFHGDGLSVVGFSDNGEPVGGEDRCGRS